MENKHQYITEVYMDDITGYHTYICEYIYIYIQTCSNDSHHQYLQIHTYTNVYTVHTYIHVLRYIDTYIYIYIRHIRHIDIYIYIDIHIIHIHIYFIYIYIYIYIIHIHIYLIYIYIIETAISVYIFYLNPNRRSTHPPVTSACCLW